MNRKFYEVPKRILLLIAGLVWMAAGFNVTRLGVFPVFFVAFFYTGLGGALFLAGVIFIVRFIRR